jgi:hypothetical protein
MKVTMKTTLCTTLAAAAFAITSAANFASLPSAALGLTVGLVMSQQTMAATNKPVPGVGIKICKRPGGCSARSLPTKTANDGSFNFSGIEAGDYEVTPDGGKTAMFKVGSDGKLSGVLQDGGLVQTKPGVQNLGTPSAEKGIKDNAVKSCGSCGLTGKEAAPAAPGAAETKPATN